MCCLHKTKVQKVKTQLFDKEKTSKSTTALSMTDAWTLSQMDWISGDTLTHTAKEEEGLLCSSLYFVFVMHNIL